MWHSMVQEQRMLAFFQFIPTPGPSNRHAWSFGRVEDSIGEDQVMLEMVSPGIGLGCIHWRKGNILAHITNPNC